MVKFSKFLSVLLSFVLILISVFTVFQIRIFAANQRVGYIFGEDVNIRKSASTSSSVVANVSKISVSVLDETPDADKKVNPKTNKTYIWYKITYQSSDKTVIGYVREDLIEIYEIEDDADFEKQIKNFPKSYHEDLKLLHALYPNWTFTADIVPTTFSQAVSSQDYLFYKLIQSSDNSLRSLRKGCYNWKTGKFVETDSGGWYGASREVIAYYMDPRNFLNANDIFQFLTQTYNKKTQTIDGVKAIIKDTFLDAKINDSKDSFNNKYFADVLMEAASVSNVNPYVLASTIIQEQGRNGSTLSKGNTYNNKRVYNFFNYGASGDTSKEVIENGIIYAYNEGWTTRSKAIIEGAKKYASGYISAGQDTYFYKNYNVLNPDELWHQYAQNVADSINSSKFLKTVYLEQKDLNLNFRIPVYSSMPDVVSAFPVKNSKLNNYYFDEISVDGLTPSYERYTYEYSLSIDGNETIKLELPKGATLYGNTKVSLKKGQNEVKIAIISQTGYSNVYTINVDAQKSCKLTLKVMNNTESSSGSSSSSNDSKEDLKFLKGDTNQDEKVDIIDLANIRLHLLDIKELKGDNLKRSDTNNDGEITILDLANIRLHLLEIIKLK